MIRKLFLFFIAFYSIYSHAVYGQNFFTKRETDSVLRKLQYQNIEEARTIEAIHDINEALPRMKSDTAKIFLNKQKAYLFGRLRNIPMVLKSHLDNQDMINRSNNVEEKIFQHLALAEVYSYLKMFTLTFENLDAAEKLMHSSKIKSPKLLLGITSIRQNALFDSKDYEKCITTSKEFLKTKTDLGSPSQQQFFEMFLNQLIAKSYIELNDLLHAKSFLDRSIALDKNSIYSYQLDNNNTLINYYFKKNELDSAFMAYQSFNLIEKNSYPELLSFRYGLLMKLYASQKDEQKVSYYMMLKDSLDALNTNTNMKAVENSFLESKKEIEKSVQDKNILIFLLTISTIILLTIMFFWSRKRKAQKEQFNKISEELKNKSFITIELGDFTKIKDKNIRLEDNYTYYKDEKVIKEQKEPKEKSDVLISNISQEKELLILSQLDKYEKSEKYLNPNTSLSVLANSFKTNQTYLSEIINKHKNTNFSTYIHQLRINYLLKALEKDGYANKKYSIS